MFQRGQRRTAISQNDTVVSAQVGLLKLVNITWCASWSKPLPAYDCGYFHVHLALKQIDAITGTSYGICAKSSDCHANMQ